ncbi:MAG: hypothetical protein AB8G17_08390 [Gammaproteobacteria bacterium]
MLVVAAVFLLMALFLLNYELLWREAICEASLLETQKATCALNGESMTTARVVVAVGPNRTARGMRLPLDVTILAENGIYRSMALRPKSASAGAFEPGSLNNRHYSTLNYGVMPAEDTETVVLSMSDVPGHLKLLSVKLIPNPRNWPIHLASLGFVGFLLLATYSRRAIFRGRYIRWVPYTLTGLLSLIVLSWNS